MVDKNNPLHELFWRDEVLQIMFWYAGEGFGDTVTAAELARFLTDDAPPLEPYLVRMAADGWVAHEAGGRFRLTAIGKREGARRFADAFDELTRPAHGECSADCDCHRTGDPASCSHRQPQAHAH